VSLHPPARTSQDAQGPLWTVVLPGWEALRARLGAGRSRWLERLLARAVPDSREAPGIHAAIAEAIAGEPAASRRWAPGPVCAAADGIEAGSTTILRLDPVHLAPAGDGLIPDSPGAVDRATADALAGAIEEALGGEPRPRVGAPERWYAELAVPDGTVWTEPDEAFGRDAFDTMPTGPGGGALKRLMNEIQMVLHEHPVNRSRTAAGLPEINSVWIWGWPDPGRRGPPVWRGTVFGDHAYARGLAALAGAEHEPGAAPAAPTWPDRGLKVCDEPWRALQAGDGARAARLLERFDRTWGEPLLRAVQRGRLRGLRLIAGRGVYSLERIRAWHFWRRWPADGPDP
jgi:hypothetical protein